MKANGHNKAEEFFLSDTCGVDHIIEEFPLHMSSHTQTRIIPIPSYHFSNRLFFLSLGNFTPSSQQGWSIMIESATACQINALAKNFQMFAEEFSVICQVKVRRESKRVWGIGNVGTVFLLYGTVTYS